MATRRKSASGGSPLDRLSSVAKLGLGLVMVTVVAVFYFIILYSDANKNISAAELQEAQLQKQKKEVQGLMGTYNEALEEIKRREELARDQKKILPDEAETPAFLSAIQSVATVSGVNLTAYSPTEEVSSEFYAKVPMSLKLSGKYHQIAKFFNGVGQLDRIINVEDITMSLGRQSGGPREEGDEEVIVEVECLATAFRAKQDGETAQTGRQRRRNRR